MIINVINLNTIYKRFPNFVWFDPDTSYYEDVNAFIEAFKNYAKNISNGSNEDLELFPSINIHILKIKIIKI